MNRRMFLRASGMFMALNAAPSLAQSRELSGSDSLLIRDAYSLWYNRPAVAEIAGGFCVGYIKSSGDVCVCSVDNQRLKFTPTLAGLQFRRTGDALCTHSRRAAWLAKIFAQERLSELSRQAASRPHQ